MGLLERRIQKNFVHALALAPNEPLLAYGHARTPLGAKLPQGFELPVHVDFLLTAVTPMRLFLGYVERYGRDFVAVHFSDLFNLRLTTNGQGAWLDGDCRDGSEIHVRAAGNADNKDAADFATTAIDALTHFEQTLDPGALAEREERREKIRVYRAYQAERSARLSQMSSDGALDLFGRGWIRATVDSEEMVEIEGGIGLTPDGVRVIEVQTNRNLTAKFSHLGDATTAAAEDSLVAARPYVFQNGGDALIEVPLADGGVAVIHPVDPPRTDVWLTHLAKWSGSANS